MRYQEKHLPWELMWQPHQAGVTECDSEDDCEDCGVGWIHLSALEGEQRK